VTQAGLDVTKAADYQQSFNSAWPSIKIVFETTVLVPAGATVTVPHGLSYPPLSFGWIQVGTTTLTDDYPATFLNDSNSSIGRIYPNSDATNLYVFGYFGSDTLVNLKAYNVDISTDITYPILASPSTNSTYNPDYGIALAKPGKDTSSVDLRDYILHTKAQSPSVQAVVTQASGLDTGNAGEPTLYYINPAPYVPWVFGYLQQTSTYLSALPVSTQTGSVVNSLTVSANLFSITYDASSYSGASIVVLRDPLFAPNSVDVTYNG
jgi:hypothetical protein